MPINQEAAKKLTTARAQLILNHGFFGMLALRMRLVERPGIKTLAVDGRTIFYNPVFVMEELSDSLTRAALAHEIMHPALDHLSRLNERNAKKWNMACDYAINLLLEEAGFEIGKSWLLNKAYAGMSADQIYQLIPDPPENDDGNSDGGPGPLDEMLPGDPSTAAADAIDWKIATIQAAEQVKNSGKLPAQLQRLVEEAAQPRVDWRDQLRRFMTQIGRDDYSWSRPNRRFLSAGLYLPGAYSENMGEVVIGIDTSGSIDDKTLQAFAAEIRAITAMTRPSKVHVVYCDAEVNHVDEFGPHEEIQLKPHGGGGTAFEPVFDYVEENDIKPECLVYLTDLYGDHGFAPPPYPTLWACTTNQVASFGDTIEIEV